MSASLITAIGAVIIALVTGVFGWMNSTKANRPAESNAQLAWVKQAQDEATGARQEAREAKQEAREAKAESSAARAESEQTREQTRQQQVRLQREMDAMQDWVDRVIRARDAYLADLEAAGKALEDTGAIRLLRAINGGPHLEQS